MMTFRVVHKPFNNHVRCPYRVVEQSTGTVAAGSTSALSRSFPPLLSKTDPPRLI